MTFDKSISKRFYLCPQHFFPLHLGYLFVRNSDCLAFSGILQFNGNICTSTATYSYMFHTFLVDAVTHSIWCVGNSAKWRWLRHSHQSFISKWKRVKLPTPFAATIQRCRRIRNEKYLEQTRLNGSSFHLKLAKEHMNFLVNILNMFAIRRSYIYNKFNHIFSKVVFVR